MSSPISSGSGRRCFSPSSGRSSWWRRGSSARRSSFRRVNRCTSLTFPRGRSGRHSPTPLPIETGGSPDPISIEHAPTRLVVDSPGPLVAGVTVENILAHPSKPRNRVLTEAIRKLGLAEQAGVGVDRMYRDMIRGGHQPPQISESDYVRVALTGGAPNKPFARYLATLPATLTDDVDAMLVLFTLLSKRTVAAENLQPIIQKSVESRKDRAVCGLITTPEDQN